MTVIQRTPNLGIGIRMRRVSAAPAAAAAPGPDPVGGTPVWVGMDGATEIEVRALDSATCNAYPIATWSGVVEGVADVVWSVAFTPVISVSIESLEIYREEVWRGATVTLTVPPVPVPGHPYPPTYYPVPNPLVVSGNEYRPWDYWARESLWEPLFLWGEGDSVALAGPSVFVANGALVVSAWGRCMSGELVATAFRGGVELGQLSLALVAYNFISDIG